MSARSLFSRPSRLGGVTLAALPFLLMIAAYLSASHFRLADNPQDKLLPSVSKMVDAVERMAFTRDRRTGEFLALNDTLSSLKRLGIGVGIAASVGLSFGLLVGLFPMARATVMPWLTFVSMVPPLAILPILFISFGVGELGKVVLIVLGVFPVISRDIGLAVSAIPRQQIVKTLTLGGSASQLVWHIILPQMVPRLLDSVRLALGAAWLFLIASEAIASTDGLGYRIFLVRRYLAMDVIIPYVLWITFLGYAMDWSLRRLVSWRYPWYREQ